MLFFGTTIDGLQMGLCFAVIALGVYISYSILDFPDLSVDGTFPLGGVVCTILMLKLGLPPILATFLTFLSDCSQARSPDCSTSNLRSPSSFQVSSS